jgi:hypothetical protein
MVSLADGACKKKGESGDGKAAWSDDRTIETDETKDRL